MNDTNPTAPTYNTISGFEGIQDDIQLSPELEDILFDLVIETDVDVVPHVYVATFDTTERSVLGRWNYPFSKAWFSLRACKFLLTRDAELRHRCLPQGAGDRTHFFMARKIKPGMDPKDIDPRLRDTHEIITFEIGGTLLLLQLMVITFHSDKYLVRTTPFTGAGMMLVDGNKFLVPSVAR